MKRLMLIISLVVFPLISHADRGWRYDKHQQAYHFWNTVEQRLDRQFHRIEHGIKHGDLTPWQAKKLQRQQKRIVRNIEQIRRKHRLSNYDKQKIIAYLDESSDQISRLKKTARYRRNDHRHSAHYQSGDGPIAWSNNNPEIRFQFKF